MEDHQYFMGLELKPLSFKVSYFTNRLLLTLLMSSIFFGCNQKSGETNLDKEKVDLAALEKEIELRLREYENYLKNEDSIALGNMYTVNAEVLPSIVGRDNITKVIGGMIRDGITGSSFKTVHLWGDEQLLVEEGRATWSNKNGEIVDTGRYLLVWQKEEGEWKILRDTWFGDEKN
ncbi:nuclear transport factor 2 family protein [Cyclobacteriaceae bacterium YHN15]|nr:nuclear transport factor 2 family protein [Cyclobacteriaceae bacterium YHN15]